MTMRTSLRLLAVSGVAALATASGIGASQAAAPTLADAAAVAQPVAADVPAICLQKPSIICASKTERKLRLFESGKEVMTADARFGRPGYETPKGTWTVEDKDRSTWWSYPFNVYMPWGLKFDLKDGLYVHYSSGFALNPQTYIGSHGCIQVGDWEFAKTLYNRVKVGTTVHAY